jgi:hypothetical protein
MLLAVATMSATVRMIFLLAALVLFVLASIGYSRGKVSFLAAGLACLTFPWFWDALAAV